MSSLRPGSGWALARARRHDPPSAADSEGRPGRTETPLSGRPRATQPRRRCWPAGGLLIYPCVVRRSPVHQLRLAKPKRNLSSGTLDAVARMHRIPARQAVSCGSRDARTTGTMTNALLTQTTVCYSGCVAHIRGLLTQTTVYYSDCVAHIRGLLGPRSSMAAYWMLVIANAGSPRPMWPVVTVVALVSAHAYVPADVNAEVAADGTQVCDERIGLADELSCPSYNPLALPYLLSIIHVRIVVFKQSLDRLGSEHSRVVPSRPQVPTRGTARASERSAARCVPHSACRKECAPLLHCPDHLTALARTVLQAQLSAAKASALPV